MCGQLRKQWQLSNKFLVATPSRWSEAAPVTSSSWLRPQSFLMIPALYRALLLCQDLPTKERAWHFARSACLRPFKSSHNKMKGKGEEPFYESKSFPNPMWQQWSGPAESYAAWAQMWVPMKTHLNVRDRWGRNTINWPSLLAPRQRAWQGGRGWLFLKNRTGRSDR